jgi:peptidoglycan hydrolase-like protein with peptidoglycan-binding domain
MTTTSTGIKTRLGMLVALALTAGLAACASDDTTTAAAPAPAPVAAPAPAPAPAPMTHADRTKALQTALNNNGAKLVVDGRYGKKTAHAVAAYQKAHGLKPTGRADAKTEAALGL